MLAYVQALTVAIVVALASAQTLPSPGECGVSNIAPIPPTRIVNGEAVIPHSRPYQLLLVGFFPNGTAKFYCGASLIKPTHALTAAHCVDGNAAKDIRIFPGLHEFTNAVLTPTAGIPARAFYRHGSYSSTTLANDIAVIRLETPIQPDNNRIGLICLPPASAPVCTSGNPVVASGWGSTTGDPNRNSSSRPVQLQQVALKCLSPSEPDCKTMTSSLFGLFQDKTKLCAYAPYKGVCFGDSGGPLVRERTMSDGSKYLEQVGVMSGTKDCSFTKPMPDVYADVRFFADWIVKQVQASP